MKVFFCTLIISFLIAYLAEVRITFNPFSISFGRGWLVLGIIFIMCGCICMKAQWYSDGLKRGAEIKQDVIKEIEEEKNTETL